jgi:endoglucanase
MVSLAQECYLLFSKKTIGCPDYNIVIDVTHSTDYPGASAEQDGDIKLGGGPALAYGSVNNKNLVNKLKGIAKENNIPFQINVDPRYSGTDADELHLMQGGTIPTVIVSVPLRYMHTQKEVFSMDDVVATINLLTAFVNSEL